MIWLAALGGAGPISYNYNAEGAVPVTTGIEIAGQKWNLYKGSNAPQTVFSFVAEETVGGFKGDLVAFLQYLEKEEGVGGSQILTYIGAGTEAFTYVYVVFFWNSPPSPPSFLCSLMVLVVRERVCDLLADLMCVCAVGLMSISRSRDTALRLSM